MEGPHDLLFRGQEVLPTAGKNPVDAVEVNDVAARNLGCQWARHPVAQRADGRIKSG